MNICNSSKKLNCCKIYRLLLLGSKSKSGLLLKKLADPIFMLVEWGGGQLIIVKCSCLHAKIMKLFILVYTQETGDTWATSLTRTTN